VSVPQRSIHDVLRALHDSDRRHAPPFARLMAQTRKAPSLHRRWRPAVAAAVATAVALALWLRSPGTGDAPPPAWTDWRSPTAALLFDDSVAAGADRFVSPTRSLHIPSGDHR
jgi:hypothetical protein